MAQMDACPTPKILIVDDHEDNLFVLESVLGKLDAELVRETTGSGAIEVLQRENFAMVFCDVYMPEVDGYQVAKSARETSLNKVTPIIFITAVNYAEKDILKAYSSGAVDFVYKPFLPDVLVAKAKIFLEQYHDKHELNRLKKEAERASFEKSNFIATLSHELRTPMNGVIGMNRLLLEGNLNDQEREFAQTAIDSAESLITLVNDVLDFSKMEAGKLEFELRSCLDKSAMLLAHKAQEKGVELAVVVYHDVPIKIKGDPMRLRQVILNLVSNAVKYTE